MEKFYSRICFNKGGYLKPNGDAPKYLGGDYVKEHGFGHEEWLMNPTHVLDGYRYGYVRGAGINKTQQNKEIDLALFTIGERSIKSRHKWYWVARINGAVVLDDTEAEWALTKFEKRGWLDQMVKDVLEIGGDPEELICDVHPRSVVTIKYKSSDCYLYEPFDLINDINRANMNNYHMLYHWNLGQTPDEIATIPTGCRHPLKERNILVKHSIYDYEINSYHVILQNRIQEQLEREYGIAPMLEHRWIDVYADNFDPPVLIEVKTSSSAKRAIREALGQLLEYAYYDVNNIEYGSLVVAAPVELNNIDRSYIKYLRDVLQIDIYYLFVPEEGERFSFSSNLWPSLDTM